MEIFKNNIIIKFVIFLILANYESVGDIISYKSKLVEIISYIGIDSDERYWIDILIYLDREVSFDKGSFEGVLELYRYIENVFL